MSVVTRVGHVGYSPQSSTFRGANLKSSNLEYAIYLFTLNVCEINHMCHD